MKWFSDLKIGTKLLASFVLVAATAGLIGWVGLSGMSQMQARSASMYADRLVPIRELGYANAALLTIRVNVLTILSTKNTAQREKLAADIDEQEKVLNGYIDAYSKRVLVKEEQEMLSKFQSTYKEYSRIRTTKVLPNALKGQDEEARKHMVGDAMTAQAEARKTLRALIDLNARVGEQDEKSLEAVAATARTQILGSLAVGVLLALGLGLLLVRVLGKPLRAMQAAAEKLALGDVNVSVELDTKDELGALARSFRAMTEVIKERAALAQKIAAGDVTVEVRAKSEQDLLGKSFLQVVETLRKLVAEAEMLAKAAVAGKLATRGNAEQFQGGYRQIVTGVNQTLDAVVGPLNVAAECVDRISKGDIPPKITDKYNGDFNEIKNNLNDCIDNIRALVTDTGMLVKAAVEGKLATRADAARHQGDYRKIVEGVNQTLDAVIGPLNVAAEYVDKVSRGAIPKKISDSYNGDFNTIKSNLNNCVDNINALVTDAGMLAQAAADGRVGARADAAKHQGDFRKIVEGVNRTLEAIVEPLKATAQNATTLASSSEELTAVSQQMAGNAEETATQANVVSAASEQVSKHVASVASASEQMQASIREISKNANESARVAKNAVSVAHSTNETVKKLGESSQEIGDVIKVITSIAQQTNLLALNATIEAARAGEAGKGFAVVANEVKELAKQTAKATEDISQKIAAIQGDTKGAVKAIEEIGTIINQINDISSSIASAVEEQTATTNEIGRSVTEASKGVGDIAKNIGGVAVAAKGTTQGANDTQKASQE
ncbi:MAG: MCP four helix bundle domain-containing protein, partial [Acidobacteria bacterium]|nr:MCP four helix bundle domain-containing protein [Acidobacteriota bacterium]